MTLENSVTFAHVIISAPPFYPAPMSIRTTPNAHHYPRAYLRMHCHPEQGWHSRDSTPFPASPRWSCVGLPPEDAPCPGCALDAPDRHLEFGTPPAHRQPTLSEPHNPPGSRRAHYTAGSSPNSTSQLSPLDIPTLISNWTPTSTTLSERSYTTAPRPAEMRTNLNLRSPSNRNTPHNATPCVGQLASPTTHVFNWPGSTPRIPNTIHATGTPTPKSVLQVKNIPSLLTTRQAIDQPSGQTASNDKYSQRRGRNDTANGVPLRARAGMRVAPDMPRSQDGGPVRIQQVDHSLYPVTPSLQCSERAPVPVLMFLP